MRSMNVIKQVLSRILRINRPLNGIDEGIAEGLSEGMKRKITWIDGEEEEEKEEGEEEPLPMFYNGDEVVLYNPYEGGFMVSNWEGIDPERYVVVDSNYDSKEEIFRYRLKDAVDEEDERDLWYSEEWLSLPTITSFVSKKYNPGRDLTMKMEEIEQSILSKALDDSAKQTQIDYLLDRMNEAKKDGKAREVAEIERQLAEITSN